jgi:hypothetical protein
VADEVVYLGAGESVVAVDVSDPTLPVKLAESEPLPGEDSGYDDVEIKDVLGLGISGDHLIAVRPGGITLLDIGSRSELPIIGSWLLETDLEVRSLMGPLGVRDGVAHLAGLGGVYYRGYADWSLVSLEVSDPSSTALVAETPIGLDYGWGIGDIAVDGHMLWSATFYAGSMGETGPGGLQAWDISDPSRLTLRHAQVSPTRDPSWTAPPPLYEAHGVAADGGLVAIGLRQPSTGPGRPPDQNGIAGAWFASTAPGSLVSAGRWSVEESAVDLVLDDGHLIAGLGPAGPEPQQAVSGRVALLDVSRPTGVSELDSVSLPTGVRQIAVVGEYVYVTGTDGGLTILRRTVGESLSPVLPRALVPSVQFSGQQ